ncbi:carbohydrate-binding module family 14 protein [Nocardia goodfellowii]
MLNFDCTPKPDGHYRHPSDCHKYVECLGGRAYEKVCQDCHPDPSSCPEGKLRYNESTDQCLFADEIPCLAG